MRLIDADALRLLLDEYGKPLLYEWVDPSPIRDAIEILDALPTIDAVPVIRCKDCKHYIERTFLTECMKHDLVVEPNDFCSDGERREEDELPKPD